MFKARMLKLKTEVVTYLAKLCGVFNKRIKGIKTKYNQNYCGDRHKYHALDIMYTPVESLQTRDVEKHALDIMYTDGEGLQTRDVEGHDLDGKLKLDVAEGREPNIISKEKASSSDFAKNNSTTHAQHGERLKPCVLYMHGGGWCAYDKRVFRSTCKRLCSCGTVVFNCNFRLAPKFCLEDMQQDIRAIIAFISANARKFGGDPDKIILAGDSSGAHLLSLFVNKATLHNDEIAKKVVGCAFFYGVYNLETTLNTGFKHLHTYLSSIVPPSADNYLDKLQEISPINYLSPNVPPTFICSGQIDKLNASQSEKYAQILRESGVSVTSLIFPKEFAAAKHKFITFDTNKAAKLAFSAFGEFVQTL